MARFPRSLLAPMAPEGQAGCGELMQWSAGTSGQQQEPALRRPHTPDGTLEQPVQVGGGHRLCSVASGRAADPVALCRVHQEPQIMLPSTRSILLALERRVRAPAGHAAAQLLLPMNKAQRLRMQVAPREWRPGAIPGTWRALEGGPPPAPQGLGTACPGTLAAARVPCSQTPASQVMCPCGQQTAEQSPLSMSHRLQHGWSEGRAQPLKWLLSHDM